MRKCILPRRVEAAVKKIPFLAIIAVALAPSVRAELEVTARHLVTIGYPIPAPNQPALGDLIFAQGFAWIATPGGLYRADLPLTNDSIVELVAFPGLTISDLEESPDGIVLTRERRTNDDGPADDPSALLTADGGLTWIALDGGLEECLGGSCAVLYSTEVMAPDQRIFLNAGGNVIVSDDRGATWSLLYGAKANGRIASQACYAPTFELIDSRLFIGGECPLDVAYIISGELDETGTAWVADPQPVNLPDLENRKIQFIWHRQETDEVYAGIEGALLRSEDRGGSFDFIYFTTGDDPKYPYIGTMLIPVGRPDFILAGGFDKAGGGAWLAASEDHGDTWKDLSGLLPVSGHPEDEVLFLEQSPEGEIIAGFYDATERTLSLYELGIDTPSRRRAVGRR